jgi:hypothetical protein
MDIGHIILECHKNSVLDLTYKHFTDNDVFRLLMFCQKENFQIMTLNLSLNKITDIGAKYLSQSETIIKLNLCNNKITDIGVKILSTTKTIVNLNLGCNNITDVGGEIFIRE